MPMVTQRISSPESPMNRATMIRPARRASVRSAVLALCAIVVFQVGCSNEPEAPSAETSPASPEVSAEVEAQLVPSPAARTDAPALERLDGAIHPYLTERLHDYVAKTGKMPETIYEFSNTAVDSMPPAPAGMKYMIDPADKTVKAVRK